MCFDSLLAGFAEATKKEITLEEVNPEAFGLALQYMYSDEIHFDSVMTALEVLDCAKRFDLPGRRTLFSSSLGFHDFVSIVVDHDDAVCRGLCVEGSLRLSLLQS